MKNRKVHPINSKFVSPRNSASFCKSCNHVDKCKIKEPWINTNALKIYQKRQKAKKSKATANLEEHPILCANLRCAGGQLEAKRKMENAWEDSYEKYKDQFGTEIRVLKVKTNEKTGFVDRRGYFWIPKDYDESQKILIKTGQKLDLATQK